jgi:hypothetical protein
MPRFIPIARLEPRSVCINPSLTLLLKPWRNLTQIVHGRERSGSRREQLAELLRQQGQQRLGDAADVQAMVPYIDSRLIGFCGFGPAMLMLRYGTLTTLSVCFFSRSWHIAPGYRASETPELKGSLNCRDAVATKCPSRNPFAIWIMRPLVTGRGQERSWAESREVCDFETYVLGVRPPGDPTGGA